MTDLLKQMVDALRHIENAATDPRVQRYEIRAAATEALAKFDAQAAEQADDEAPTIESLQAELASMVVNFEGMHEDRNRWKARAQAAEQAAGGGEADEWEVRADGQRVRKDRWQWGIRRIVALLWGNRQKFEIDEVVDAVRSLVPLQHADDEALARAVQGGYTRPTPAAPSDPQPEGAEPVVTDCQCIRCLRLRGEFDDIFPAECTRMVLCAVCGCKRCPHATDHRQACTDSNEPGQVGSVYGTPPADLPSLPKWGLPMPTKETP